MLNVPSFWCAGEISAARHALEGSPVALGTEETLNAQRDMDRRLPLPRDPIPEEQQFLPMEFAHRSTMLRIARSSSKFPRLSHRREVPGEIISALRMGQMTPCRRKMGDPRNCIRRLVAKTIAKQFMKIFEDATKLFQHALSTRAGCESVAHVVQLMRDRDPNCTLLSINGVGVFDLVSRR